MVTNFRDLANKSIRELTPYKPGKPIAEVERELGIQSSIKLASNENPLGASPNALKAAQNALKHMHIYPDGGGYDLKNTVSKFLNVNTNQLTFGNGSENILELIVKSYLQEGDNAVLSEFAFLTIPILIKSYGANLNVTKAANWGHDINAMLSAIDKNTRVLFLVNPNNPTGTYTKKHDFEHLLKSVPSNILVVVDEAYSEYIDSPDYPNAIEYLNDYKNLVITRTFSKVYGLAALRLGFAISSPIIADILNRARLPFNVNSVSSAAGCAAILDQEHVKKSVVLNNSGMRQLTAGLTDIGLDFIPSLGNFVTIDVKNANDIYHKLLHQGVIVRPLDSYNMPRHIRVSIGKPDENERFLRTIKNTLTMKV